MNDYLTTRLNVAWARKAYSSEGYDGPVKIKRTTYSKYQIDLMFPEHVRDIAKTLFF